MKLDAFTDNVDHDGNRFTVHAARARGGHAVTVLCKGKIRRYRIGGRFGAELRNAAVRAFIREELETQGR